MGVTPLQQSAMSFYGCSALYRSTDFIMRMGALMHFLREEIPNVL